MGAQKEMSFLDHLEELRWHIIRALCAVLIAATAAFVAKGFIFETLIFGPTKSDFFTYEFLCNASRLLGFESFWDSFLLTFGHPLLLD
jgi:sec-independent protein translocase protein TatC